jgi:hypothetical protein
MNTIEPADPSLHLQRVPHADTDHHDPEGALRHVEAQLAAVVAMVADLRVALASRDVIGQAKGIIIASTGCTSDEAFALLKAQSQAENRKVTVIAAELVARRTGTSPRPLGTQDRDPRRV